MTIYNLPASILDLVVARECNGDWWFWGTWPQDDAEDAYNAAREIGGEVFNAGDLI